MQNRNHTEHNIIIEPELPGDGNWQCDEFYFPSLAEPNRRYLTIKFNIPGNKWVGHFIPGYGSLTGVWNVIDSNALIIIADGQAYYVFINKPLKSYQIATDSVCDVRSVQKDSTVILNDQLQLTAINKNGVTWQSERIVLDDLSIVSIEEDRVICIGQVDYGVTGEVIFNLSDGAEFRKAKKRKRFFNIFS